MATSEINRYTKIKRILIATLFLNWGVALAKILYGLFSRCSSMTADGFHSLADGTSNIICLIGITFASQPKDKDHPYGHKKFETLFSLGIAFLLFLVCYELLETSIRRLRNPIIPHIDFKSFLVMLLTMGVNFFVMKYEFKKGEDLQSDLLISDSLHTKADLFISASVIITLFAIKLGYPILDPIITMGIALLIAFMAINIARQSSRILCDETVIIEDKKISDIVLLIAGVKNCHKIRTRGRTDDIHIDLHVQVNPNMHIAQAHKISYEIEEAIKNGIHGVTDVVVHMEPKEKEAEHK